MNDDTRSLETFAIRQKDLETLVSEALRSGGSYCDLFFENTTVSNLMLRDGEVSSGGYTVDYGCGIRVLDGEKTGYAYSESTDMRSLLEAARAAGAISGHTRRGVTSHPRPDRGSRCPIGVGHDGTTVGHDNNFYPMSRDWRSCNPADFVDGLHKLESLIRAKDSRVAKVIALLGYSVSEILMYNSLDELTSDLRPMASLSVQVVYHSKGSVQTKTASRSFRMGVEFFTDELISEVATEATSGVDAMFEARRPAGGRMSVVMGAGASGILLHEAMGHAFEADFNRKGQSIFAGKIGQQICRKGINIVDDGTLPFFRGSCNYDDEGVPGQKTYMVTDGVLTSYLHDRISAGFYGVAPTGNGHRESFRYNPIPRMRSTYMENGADGTVEDLIKTAGSGIYVDEFANGEVKIGEGDFTFYVKSGYLIENGRLTMPVKDINIIGNGPQALADIVAVAGDLKVDPGRWTCGKGQSAPVSCGIPSVLIENLTVGGAQ
ncbi:MAG: TldD/PmbA family protein [Bacteroidales bacterium]|nr:TldD/PmbA family protein [Bacteroidales bacterium]